MPSIHLPLTRDGHGCPKLNAQSFARMRNQQSVHLARVIVLGKGTAKPTERSFKGKGVGDFRGIVRFWKVMRSDGRCGNPSGSRPNFLGRQHLTFDKGGKFSARQGIVRFFEG